MQDRDTRDDRLFVVGPDEESDPTHLTALSVINTACAAQCEAFNPDCAIHIHIPLDTTPCAECNKPCFKKFLDLGSCPLAGTEPKYKLAESRIENHKLAPFY